MNRKHIISQVPNRRIHGNKKKRGNRDQISLEDHYRPATVYLQSSDMWQERKRTIKHRWVKPFIWIEWLLFSKPVFKFFQLIAYIWIMYGIFVYYQGKDDRIKQKHYQAWQAINLAQGKPGSGGRIQALEELNEDHVSLNGIDVAKAYLVDINLPRANLWGANLREANLQGAILHDADLRGAYLWEAKLREANLQGAYLQGANLPGANLQGANLWGAKNITIEQLSKVKNLYKTKLDPEIEEQIKKNYPHLLEEPKDEIK